MLVFPPTVMRVSEGYYECKCVRRVVFEAGGTCKSAISVTYYAPTPISIHNTFPDRICEIREGSFSLYTFDNTITIDVIGSVFFIPLDFNKLARLPEGDA